MQIDPTIFRAYDIRGIYPTQVNEDIAYALGRAYATWLKQEVSAGTLKVAVGSDMRLSSPALRSRVIQGLADSGVNVDDIGLVSSPTFYFAVAYFKYDGGLQVSASHNPKEWNGLKIVRRQGVPVSGETGILAIRDIIQNETYCPLSPQQGLVSVKSDVLVAEVSSQSQLVDLTKIKALKVAIDPANAMGSLDMTALFQKLPCQVVKINFDLDGNFPAHEADPFKPENTKQISELVVAQTADLGIAIDGDGDRYFILDELGRVIPPPILRGLMAQIELREHPGAIVAYDIRPGRITRDMIEQSGGKPVVTRVGHSLIKETMIREGAIFGGEGSGHYFYKLDYGTFEAPMVMVLKLLKFISESNQPLSQILKPFMIYFHSGEINTKVATREQALRTIEEIKTKYSQGKQDFLDGVTVEFSDFWFNLRVSNTEPVIRLTVEAKSEELMKQKTQELLGLIRK